MDPVIAVKLNLWATVVSALAGCTAYFTTLFGQGPTQKIMAGVGIAGVIVGAVNTALHAYSPPKAGPLA